MTEDRFKSMLRDRHVSMVYTPSLAWDLLVMVQSGAVDVIRLRNRGKTNQICVNSCGDWILSLPRKKAPMMSSFGTLSKCV